MSGVNFPFLAKLKRKHPDQSIEEYLMNEMRQNLKAIEDALKKNFYYEKEFNINELVSVFAGQNGIDGLFVLPFNIRIIDIITYSNVPGSSGETEFDLKYSSAFNNGSFGEFVSIFSQRPKIFTDSQAFTSLGLGTKANGTITPTMDSRFVFMNKGDRIRFDCISAMTDSKNAGIKIVYQLR